MPEMTMTAQQVVAEGKQPTPVPERDPKAKKRHDEFRQRADVCKAYKRKLIPNWTVSIDYRRGKPFSSQSDDDTIAVNLDWSYTKTKQAALFSQVPQVRISHFPKSASAGPWLASFESRLNDTLVTAGIEAAMDECLPDCINAAGFGVAMVSYEAITEDKEVPAIDLATFPPEIVAQIRQSGKLPDGSSVPMETVPQVVDYRYVVERISPSDFLWPIHFTGSNFDNAPWLGRSGRIQWAEAVQKYKLTEADKNKVVGEERTVLDRLTDDFEREQAQADDLVGFDEIFYKEFRYDPDAKSYSTIHHLVFIVGKDEPVVDESWKGQRLSDNEGSSVVIGSMKNPIRVLTLTYITDETIPPSDSAIGRPQVNEINKSRTQVLRQRERNIPMRWADINRTDPLILQTIMRGTWQNVIPVQGDGSRILGEVARAGHPQENFTFDQIAKSDLSEAWTIGPNQMGTGAGVETAGESGEIASNFQTRVGRERAKVASFFVGIAEVLGGLMCLYEEPTSFGEGFDPSFSKALTFSILADSTVLVDSNQRLERLNKFVNTYAKSGYVALEPVLKEIAILSGLDPNTVIKAPDPEPPVAPNISLRFTGMKDMSNPLALAFLLNSGQAPSPELIEQAKQLIQASVIVQPPAPPQGTGQPPDQAGPPPPEVPPMSPEGAAMPQPPPTPIGEAEPNATILPTITKRSGMNEGGTEGEV